MKNASNEHFLPGLLCHHVPSQVIAVAYRWSDPASRVVASAPMVIGQLDVMPRGGVAPEWDRPYSMFIMTVAEIKLMTLTEKLKVMEAIWVDLREHVDDCAIPSEHKSLLDARRRRVETGEASLRNWDEVKSTIGRR